MSRAINFRAWNNDNNDWLNENDADLLTIHENPELLNNQ